MVASRDGPRNAKGAGDEAAPHSRNMDWPSTGIIPYRPGYWVKIPAAWIEKISTWGLPTFSVACWIVNAVNVEIQGTDGKRIGLIVIRNRGGPPRHEIVSATTIADALGICAQVVRQSLQVLEKQKVIVTRRCGQGYTIALWRSHLDLGERSKTNARQVYQAQESQALRLLQSIKPRKVT